MSMKLGTETGSLTNHIMSRMVIGQPEPEEGMGATILAWTDRHAGTIEKIYRSCKQVILFVREDNATRVDANGMSECQTYEYSPNPRGRIYCFRQTKSGAWEEVARNECTNRWNKTNGYGLRIGKRSTYRDFSF